MFLYSYYTIYFLLIQVFGPISITCVNSMDMSYIPIAEARGFTTHLIIRATNTPSMRVAIRNGMLARDTSIKHYRGVDMLHVRFVAKA